MTSPPAPLWLPAASLERLAGRAAILAQVRQFFAQRGVMEVETPQLCAAAPAEEHIEPLRCQSPLTTDGPPHYLHTSPEAAMKRLLAAGSGAIYQICRAFRHGESGVLHNPEFTMLEWYRPGWSYHQLMREVYDLVAPIVAVGEPLYVTYQQAFQRWAMVDPFAADDTALIQAAQRQGQQPPPGLDRDGLLDFLLTTLVEPALQHHGDAVFLYDFPPSRAAMAEINPGPPATARRFELYVHGIELTNGYQELTDAQEQSHRLTLANQRRLLAGLPPLPMDTHFLAAMAAGLPPCAGVALGVDRLVMLGLGERCIQKVMTFPIDRI